MLHLCLCNTGTKPAPGVTHLGKILSFLKVRDKYVLNHLILPKPGPMSSVITGFSNLFFWSSLDFAAHGIKNVLNYLEDLGQERFFLNN
jgi:hypothetical protein